MLLLLVLLLLLPLRVAAQEVGTLTRIEGALQVIRATTVLRGTEGMQLQREDILQSANPGFAQIELPGGAVVALGDSTRLFLTRSTKGTSSEIVLLSGWLKGETSSRPDAYNYLTSQLSATTRGGTLLVHAVSEATEIFVESGSAGVGEVGPGCDSRSPGNAKAGQFFARYAGKPVTMQSRPNANFIDSMPRAFRDTLPQRLPDFAGKQVVPKREHEVTYSEIEPWLIAGRIFCKSFTKRFEPRLQDPSFRKAVEAHLGDYPEWKRVLYPEKYNSSGTGTPTDTPNSQ